MTSTKETDSKNSTTIKTANLLENQLTTEPKIEPTFAGLSVILRTTQTNTTPVNLSEWLQTEDIQEDIKPIWIPLRKTDGVTKIMAVLPDANLYDNFMGMLWGQIAGSNLVEWRQKPYEISGVEVNSDSLHKIAIAIYSVQPLPPTLARAIHALCFRWFANTSPELAANLHQQESLPLTTGWEYCSPKKILLKISLLQKELLAPLLWGINADLGKEITIAGIPCRMDAWIDIAQTTSFEKIAQSPTQNTIDLRFLTPTSFKQAKNVQPFPLPELVFNGLLRRWNLFAPEALKFPKIEWNGMVSAYDLKTYAMKMEGGAEIGAEGLVKYKFADSEQARIATTLAQFASYAGVGRKTAMGMGQVEIPN
ncbi:CRISPR system precrRNA processing endoribonuclease RAMP protein Cas6 [Calothrix sp. UHCC 0171]|uniref:CRISPR system precrRNA processing endoribonuclease RAMP protein Cas6 n=1 Tax=Calothrix sp. UHCC 0171 TaxID=3110245 RepID=UPI002B2043EF|nr:CRISPR system precrRNA processing endoribonuclease RAMP protein Cas6 [Calothrix sp. UHCC 0171]MEA5573556.1 CRISPR system precrRNA processing endoribonuclease RAMP protein Cas6 [Calothrix sp. UHCC 0171]